RAPLAAHPGPLRCPLRGAGNGGGAAPGDPPARGPREAGAAGPERRAGERAAGEDQGGEKAALQRGEDPEAREAAAGGTRRGAIRGAAGVGVGADGTAYHANIGTASAPWRIP